MTDVSIRTDIYNGIIACIDKYTEQCLRSGRLFGGGNHNAHNGRYRVLCAASIEKQEKAQNSDADHRLGEEFIKKLPELIENPLAIITSKTRPTDSVVVIMGEDKQMAAVQISGSGNINGERIDAARVTSVYSKKSLKGLWEKAILSELKGNTAVFYTNTKKEPSQWASEWLQLPDSYLHQDGSIWHSITDKGSPVKARIGENSIWNPRQLNKFRNGGNLQVWYHQTGADIEEFDIRHEGAGTSDTDMPYGVFLKPSADDIGLAGKKQIPLYAKMDKSLRVKNREELRNMLDKMDPNIAKLRDDIGRMNAEYEKRYEEAENASKEYFEAWKKEHPEENSRKVYEDLRYIELTEAEEKTEAEREAKEKEMTADLKELPIFCGFEIHTKSSRPYI